MPGWDNLTTVVAIIGMLIASLITLIGGWLSDDIRKGFERVAEALEKRNGDQP